ncbi:ABC transporter permease [Candidatus Saccharibacteria bacterium]|nr:ABC transporter permease [Candidatus Saccharibacteria bacterium]
MSALSVNFSKRNRVLLGELIKTDFKLRYQGSVLGYMWAIIKPLLMFAILYVVFAKVLRFGDGIPHYPVYLLTGTVLWNFFTECTFQGIHAIEQRGDLIRKISFPKYVVVVSATSTALINLSINIVVVVLFALINGVAPTWSWLLVPLSIVELYTLALGISLLLGAINVKFRDIGSIWEVLMQAMFYAVPIIYPITMVTATSTIVAQIMLVNPIAQVIQDVRNNLITAEAVTTWELVGPLGGIASIGIVVVVMIVAVLYFRKKAKYFAEEV